MKGLGQEKYLFGNPNIYLYLYIYVLCFASYSDVSYCWVWYEISQDYIVACLDVVLPVPHIDDHVMLRAHLNIL